LSLRALLHVLPALLLPLLPLLLLLQRNCQPATHLFAELFQLCCIYYCVVPVYYAG
jgi:hypothetical protein